jgi:hypothetical protein
MRGEGGADAGEVADVLVPHDDRRAAQRQRVLMHVGSADAGDLDLQQRRVGRDLGQRYFPKLRCCRPDLERGQHSF